MGGKVGDKDQKEGGEEREKLFEVYGMQKETISGTVSTEHNPIRSWKRKGVCEG